MIRAFLLTPVFSVALLWGGGDQGAACHLIEAAAIHGRDLAAVLPVFAGIPPDAPVGPTPVPGMQRVFAPPELRRLAREYGLAPSVFASNICFVWPVEPLTPSVIEQAL